MIHLIQVDRDGIMSFACDEVELFTTQGATRDIFRMFVQAGEEAHDGAGGRVECCQYCTKILTEKNSRVARSR
jgi:hypothetical protein